MAMTFPRQDYLLSPIVANAVYSLVNPVVTYEKIFFMLHRVSQLGRYALAVEDKNYDESDINFRRYLIARNYVERVVKVLNRVGLVAIATYVKQQWYL